MVDNKTRETPGFPVSYVSVLSTTTTISEEEALEAYRLTWFICRPGCLGELLPNKQKANNQQNNSTSTRQSFLHSHWPLCDHSGGLWVPLATCLIGFCSAPVYLFYQEGGSVSVPCMALIKIREALATKQSFQKPAPGFPGCRAACTDTQSHWCRNYYCHPIIVIIMPIQLPLCKFLEGRDRVLGCFSWIHAFLLPFTHPTNIYWVQPSLCPHRATDTENTPRPVCPQYHSPALAASPRPPFQEWRPK